MGKSGRAEKLHEIRGSIYQQEPGCFRERILEHHQPELRESYYQQIVAVAILWKRTETIVSTGRGDWYEGDYRPQIVALAFPVVSFIASLRS